MRFARAPSDADPDARPMYVVATAGHVDHGKSTLVRALTGMEPDRFAEEQRRGMTIDLGYAWTTLPTGEQLAFVDVPGHQRFIANMLAGLGPAPAVLFVVAADEGWSRQSSEHLAAVTALGVRHVVLAVTRSDRADAGAVVEEATQRLVSSGLDRVEAVVASGLTGVGLDELRAALARMLDRLPAPDARAPVRFWIDRSFSIRGAGTVVTGTLGSGSMTVGDQYALRDQAVTVRGIQRAGVSETSVDPVSRVALNLRTVTPDMVGRGDVLLTPGRFLPTSVVDARLDPPDRLPTELMLHVGTAAVPVRVRPLGGTTARLTLSRPMPLRAGDRAVLRDPGRQAVAAGVLVLDADPPALQRRGAARARAGELATATVPPTAADEIGRRGVVARRHLDLLGIDTSGIADVAGWLVSPDRRAALLARVPGAVAQWAGAHPLDPGMPHGALARQLEVPGAVLDSLLSEAGLRTTDGRVGVAGPPRALGPAEVALATLLARLTVRPFDAPDRDELRELGLGRRELAAAARAGRVIQVAEGIVLGPDVVTTAVEVLGGLPPPFTLSAARQALGTTRRVAVPLLEYLDAEGVTERVDANTRRVKDRGQ